MTTDENTESELKYKGIQREKLPSSKRVNHKAKTQGSRLPRQQELSQCSRYTGNVCSNDKNLSTIFKLTWDSLTDCVLGIGGKMSQESGDDLSIK